MEERAEETDVAVRRLLADTPLVDGHNDLPWKIRTLAGSVFEPPFDLASDLSRLEPRIHTDVRRLRAGGVGGQFWSIYVPCERVSARTPLDVLDQIDLVYRMTQRYPRDLELARTADDIERIHRSGRVASLLGIEGGHAIGGSLSVLRQFAALGVRYMSLTHTCGVGWADSATDAPHARGLTRFGRAVVLEMNRLGMIVDLAHVSSDTMNAVLDIARSPVMFSHSSARALVDHPRNVPDALLTRLAENGGVAMVALVPAYISEQVRHWEAVEAAERARLQTIHPGDPDRVQGRLTAWRAASPRPAATLCDVADHLDHMRRIAGSDHVGIGSDFDGTDHVPEGLEDVSRLPSLLAELLRRGWSVEDVRKAAGLNVLRVLRAATNVAASLADEMPPREMLQEQMDGPSKGTAT